MREKERITYIKNEKGSIQTDFLTQKHWAILSALMSKKGHLLKAKQIQYYINHGSYGLNKGEEGNGSKIIVYLRELKNGGFLNSQEKCRGDDWFLAEEGKEFINNWFRRLAFLSPELKNLVKEILLVLAMKGRTTKISIKELRSILTSKRGTSLKEPLDLPPKNKFKRIIFTLDSEDLIELDISEDDKIEDVHLRITWKGKAISQGFKKKEESEK